MRIIPALLLSASLLAAGSVYAQDDKTKKEDSGDDLMAMLDSESGAKKKDYTTATFKATRVINGHSIENLGAGVLDFRIVHRFGAINNGAKDFFGLDAANTNIGLDYGVTDWLMVGINRSTYQKEIQGFAKVKLLRQQNNGGMPISISYMGAMSAQTLPVDPALIAPVTMPNGSVVTPEYHFSNRLFFVNQLLIAHKFSNSFSLQLMPTHIHYNLVPKTSDPNDIVALGIGGRLKLSNRISLTGEYFYRFNEMLNPSGQEYYNSLSVGIDIETGGHVFQLMFTNATATTERSFIGQNFDSWTDSKSGIHFGFNISRVFTIVKPKGFESSRNKIW